MKASKIVQWILLISVVVVMVIFFPNAIGPTIFWGVLIFLLSKTKWHKDIRSSISPSLRNYMTVAAIIISVTMVLLAFCIKEEVISKGIGIILFIFIPLITLIGVFIFYQITHKNSQ